MRYGTREAPYALLKPVNGALEFASTYDAGLVAEFKRRVPPEARRWEPTIKRWLIDPAYGPIVSQVAEAFLGVVVPVPSVVAVAQFETRLLRVEYIGACKDRGNGELSAYGHVAGDWSLLLLESVLREWFQAAEQRPDEKPTLYAVLTVRRDVGEDDLKKAFRRLAKHWHPDVSKEPDSAEQFKLINHAYEVLSDPIKRKKYDIGMRLEASVRTAGELGTTGVQIGYRSPLRCGWLMVEGRDVIGRFNVSKIIEWADVVRGDGKVMVTSWPKGADHYEVNWQ